MGSDNSFKYEVTYKLLILGKIYQKVTSANRGDKVTKFDMLIVMNFFKIGEKIFLNIFVTVI